MGEILTCREDLIYQALDVKSPRNIVNIVFLNNPLTLSSNQYATSPNNIYTLSSKQVMRILKLFS